MNFKNLFVIYHLLFLNICLIYSKNFTLNFLTYSIVEDKNENIYYQSLIDGFNKYSENNNLGINVELIILTPSDSDSYDTALYSILLDKSKNYDIYFYYSAYTKKYSDHFINLRDYLPEETLKDFDKKVLNEACSSNDYKLVGLPVYINLTTLFSNKDLLLKYNKEVPKTWDELMSTSKHIYEEEKKQNNTIIRYNGLFDDINGSISLYEFISSFRESNNSPHPGIKSKTTIEALEKLKEMKDEIGEDIFRASADLTFENLYSGKALFLKYFNVPYREVYEVSTLPGRIKGVSGTVAIPSNLAINTYIDEDRKRAAVEFLKYIASKEIQKKNVIYEKRISADMEIYNDDEVCSKIKCDIIKDAYPFSFINNDVRLFGNNDYYEKYRDNMFDYLYNDKPLSEVLNNIEKLTVRNKTSTKTSDVKNTRNTSGISLFISLLFMLCWLLF